MFFLKRLKTYLFGKVLNVKVSTLCWTVFIGIFLCCICTFGYTRRHNYNNVNSLEEVQNLGHPVIVWWTDEFYATLPGYIECPKKCEVVRRNESEHKFVEAYLFYGTHFHFDDVPFPRRWETVLWGLFHEESPRNNIKLMHEETLKLFNYSATFSRYSDYPFPLQYLRNIDDITSTKYFVETAKKNALLDKLAPIIFVQSDCDTPTGRDEYVAKLMQFIKVDSYGECLNNKDLPSKFKEDYLNNIYEENFLHFIARYKFMITIENGICKDYITEKLWRALIAGTVPIYFGSPTVRDWLPNNNSAILLEDYRSPEIMKAHLQKLMEDDVLYDSYLEHKVRRIITKQRLFEELNARPDQFQLEDSAEKFQCLICEKLHQKRDEVPKVLDKTHYDCPKPVSALSLAVDRNNFWVAMWEEAKHELHELYKKWGIVK